MILKKLPVGLFETNCFLVFMPEKKLLLIIDPGSDAEKIVAEAEKFDFEEARILLTHAHIDHISGCGAVAKALNIKHVELAPEDNFMYLSESNCLEPYFPPAKDLPPVKNFSPVPDCKILSLPGHTPGGSGFLFDDGKDSFLIAGDTIFCGSVGRTDLPGGDYGQLLESIQKNILTLPDDLTVYPGHGGETTVIFEKKNNPYLIQE